MKTFLYFLMGLNATLGIVDSTVFFQTGDSKYALLAVLQALTIGLLYAGIKGVKNG